jgi:hypothetical protein
MTRQTKRKIGVIGLKLVAIASSVGVPVAAVLQEFPIFKEPMTTKELSAGGVMILLIVLFGFRRELWPLIKEKLHVNSAGTLIFWGLSFLLILWLEKVAAMLPAMRTICIAGLAGTGIGQVANTAAGFIGKKNKEVAENVED